LRLFDVGLADAHVGPAHGRDLELGERLAVNPPARDLRYLRVAHASLAGFPDRLTEVEQRREVIG
jgi:hypothetical protein